MSETGWTALVVAVIGAFGTAFGGVILQALQMWFSYKRDLTLKSKVDDAKVEAIAAKQQAAVVEKKIDENTAVTQAGTTAASISAKDAAETAVQAKAATESMADTINKKLNGGIDSAISKAVAPVQESLDNHKIKFDALDAKVEELKVYMHERNHNLLNGLDTISKRLELVFQIIKLQQEEKK